MTVTGHEAYYFEYAMNYYDPVKVKQICVENGDGVFELTYGAKEKDYDKFLPEFNQSISSFRILSQ